VTRPLRPLAAVVVGLLAGQFLSGMVTNLNAPIPTAVPGLHGNFDARLGAAARGALLHGPPELKIHVVVGLATGACAIALAMLALRTQQRPQRLLALLGPFTAAPAGLVGAAFLAYHQDNLYSLLMSIGFLAPSSATGPACTSRAERNRATHHREHGLTSGVLIAAAGQRAGRPGKPRHADPATQL
jgi:hypothetical protein